MREMLEGYIAACDENIAKYMLIEDAEERERSVAAARGMRADFEKLLEEL